MAARSTTQTLVSQTDLRSCTDAASVFDLFRKLRYPVEPQPIAISIEHDELPESFRDGIAARYPVAQLGGARPGDPSLDITLFVLSDAAHKSALVRGIAANWTRRYPGQHLFVFATQSATATGDFDQLTFVNTERLGEGAQVRVKLRKLIVERSHPTRHDADTLNRIALAAPTEPATAAHKAQVDAFNVERMTDQFYKGYSQLFKNAVEHIKAGNPGIADFYDPSKLHAFAQRLFGRVMFLYFLQKKRSLDNNLNFIAQHYDDAVRRNENFYQSVLEPLFFDTLNQPRQDARSPKFGRVPYLNGGLFARDDLDHRGEVYLDNDLFDARGEGGILYFLNNHNFTIEEDTPLEVEVALDPEMLGKVFENLLEAEERGKSGTFYTPRPVVAFMCREALASYLTRETSLTRDLLGWLLDEAETGEPVRDDAGNPRLTHHTLPRPLREHIEHALESIRVLDPAVGSGAFPLGMLALLVGVRRALYRIADAKLSPASPLVEGWKRNFIRDCLYGVDIKREAIEIARLRLWLSLVVDADPFDMEPLPNLDYKLMAGDSLIETFDGIEIYPTRPSHGPAQTSFGENEEAKRLIERLHELQDAYFQPDGTTRRDQLKQQIDAMEADIVRAALHDRQQNERMRLESVVQKLANLGGKAEPPALVAERTALTQSITATDTTLANLKAGQPLPFFLYRLHFASVFEQKDGFDIVIANPPYVSIERMPSSYKETLREAYPLVADGRADLYVYFYARSQQLLRDGGTLSFISSNKFFRARYGAKLRHFLEAKTTLRTVIDLGDAPVFDATLDPCVIIASKVEPEADHTFRSLVTASDIELDKIDNIVASQSQLLNQASGIRPSAYLADKLAEVGMPLGQYVGKKILYGIKTGRNEVFVVDEATRDRLIAEDTRSAEVLKPFLRGRDIGRYTASWAGYWMIYTYHGIDIKQYPAIERYLMPHRTILEERATNQPWYELQQPQLAYTEALKGPKILYPEIAMARRFALDTQGYYANNKAFFIPTNDQYLLGFLNSKCAWYWITEKCAPLGDPTNRGRLELRETFMRHLPVPTPTTAQRVIIEQAVGKLAEFGISHPHASEWEKEIDEVVYEMFGLNEDEIHDVERRALLGAGKRGTASTEAPLDDDVDAAE